MSEGMTNPAALASPGQRLRPAPIYPVVLQGQSKRPGSQLTNISSCDELVWSQTNEIPS